MENYDKSQSINLIMAIFAMVLLTFLAIINIKLLIFLMGVYTVIRTFLFLLSIIVSPLLKVSEEQRIRVKNSKFISAMITIIVFAASLCFLKLI